MATFEDMEKENNNESQADGKRRRKGTTTGAATAIGVGVGVALYSATDFPAWIAVGAGLALGVAQRWRLDPRNDPHIAALMGGA